MRSFAFSSTKSHNYFTVLIDSKVTLRRVTLETTCAHNETWPTEWVTHDVLDQDLQDLNNGIPIKVEVGLPPSSSCKARLEAESANGISMVEYPKEIQSSCYCGKPTKPSFTTFKLTDINSYSKESIGVEVGIAATATLVLYFRHRSHETKAWTSFISFLGPKEIDDSQIYKFVFAATQENGEGEYQILGVLTNDHGNDSKRKTKTLIPCSDCVLS